MKVDGFTLPTWAVLLLLFGLAAGLFAYTRIVWKVLAEGKGRVDAGSLGIADLVVGAMLAGYFVMVVVLGAKAPKQNLTLEAVIINACMIIMMLSALVLFLTYRRINVVRLFGLDRFGITAVVAMGVALILGAYPLVSIAAAILHPLIKTGEQQAIIKFFLDSDSEQVRVALIVTAVCVAPIAEEMIFRGYLYGILKRYFGPTAGLFLNAALFSAVHMNLAALGPLFILALCLTLAYEITGCLLVPMTMHAVFNSVTMTLLYFAPRLTEQ